MVNYNVNNDNRKKRIYVVLCIILVMIAIPILFSVILYYSTKFTKQITIKEKYIRYRNNASNYNIVDSLGNIYQIDNLWFKGDFNRAEDYHGLTIGKTYNINGYGIRVAMIDMYPKIYNYS